MMGPSAEQSTMSPIRASPCATRVSHRLRSFVKSETSSLSLSLFLSLCQSRYYVDANHRRGGLLAARNNSNAIPSLRCVTYVHAHLARVIRKIKEMLRMEELDSEIIRIQRAVISQRWLNSRRFLFSNSMTSRCYERNIVRSAVFRWRGRVSLI